MIVPAWRSEGVCTCVRVCVHVCVRMPVPLPGPAPVPAPRLHACLFPCSRHLNINMLECSTPALSAVLTLTRSQVVSYGYNLYIIGGIENTDTLCVNTLYSYNPILDALTTLAPLPEANCRGGAAVLDGQIYVTAGFNSASETGA